MSRRFSAFVLGVAAAAAVPAGFAGAEVIYVTTKAYNTGGPWGYTGKGGTGVPTRTMFAVLEDIAEKG